MTHLERLDRELGARYTDATRKSYQTQARLFLHSAGEKAAYTRDDVLAYIDGLITADKSHNSIRSAIVGIQALCRAIDCPWPLAGKPLHLPHEDDDEGLGPVLSPEEVETLIAVARTGETYGRGAVRVATCLATVYGFRVSEIARILTAGISEPHLSVVTSKSKRKREHGIPSILFEQVRCPPVRCSAESLHGMFRRLMTEHVRVPVKGEGWHAVRRALVTGLAANEVPDRLLVRFFGWSRTGSAGVVIADRYTRIDYRQVDELVFRRHPYLRAWNE